MISCAARFSLGEAGTAGLALTKHVGGTCERCLWEGPSRTSMSGLLKEFLSNIDACDPEE